MDKDTIKNIEQMIGAEIRIQQCVYRPEIGMNVYSITYYPNDYPSGVCNLSRLGSSKYK